MDIWHQTRGVGRTVDLLVVGADVFAVLGDKLLAVKRLLALIAGEALHVVLLVLVDGVLDSRVNLLVAFLHGRKHV